MRSTTNASAVPLARDANGNVIQLPDGAATWGVRRHTGGRPRTVMGMDRRPLRLSLDVNVDDIEAMLGPGTYRLDLLDEAGAPLAVTVPVTVGPPVEERRNGLGDEGDGDDDDGAMMLMPVASSSADVRLLLEANVRAMQLSFSHQQRTLETSLRVVDTLRDGVKVLAEAQAGWIKALAEAKSIDVPRNGAPWWYQAAEASKARQLAEGGDEDDDEDSDDGDDEEDVDEGPLTVWDHVHGITHDVLAPLMPVISQYCQSKLGLGEAGGATVDAPSPAPSHEAPPRPRNGNGRPPGVPMASRTAPPKVNPMALMMKLNEAKKLLTPEEIQTIGMRVARMPAEERDHWADELGALSVEGAVARIRELMRADDGAAAPGPAT